MAAVSVVDKFDSSKLVNSEDFCNFVPGEVFNRVDNRNWNSASVEMYSFSPVLLDAEPVPSINDHTLAFFGAFTIENSVPVHGEYKIDGQRIFHGNAVFGEVTVCPRYQPGDWRWRADTDENLVCGVIYLPHNILENVAEAAMDIDSNSVELIATSGRYDEFIMHVGKQLSKDINRENNINRVFAESLTQALGAYILQNYCTYAKKLEIGKGLDRSRLARVIDFIESNLDNNIGIEDMAAVAHISAYHFIRMFKLATGSTPHQYIANKRINKAKYFLAKTDEPILKIALDTGFASASNFSSAFKRIVGCAPSVYRRQSQ